MSFKTDNTYFIRFELGLKMKEIPLENRKVYYNQNLKNKFRDKLRDSYFKTNDLSEFYNDAFDVLQNFEEEFLLLNLFFEEDSESIVKAMNKNYFQESEITRENNYFLKKYKEYVSNIFNKQTVNNVDFEKFIIHEFEELTEISIRNLDLQHVFASWLIDNLHKNEFFQAIIIYSKIWQLYFSNPFDNIKAIVFLNNFLNLSKKNKFDFSSPINEVSIYINSIFQNKLSFPLIENMILIEGVKDGYKKQKQQLIDLLNENKTIHTDFSTASYTSLYQMFLETSNVTLKQKLVDFICAKIELHIMPSEEDLYFIKTQKNEKNDFLEKFNSSFYLYEHLIKSE